VPDLHKHLELARRYLRIVESGEHSDLAGIFAPGATVHQFPNRIYPSGTTATVAQMAAAFEKGRELFSRQTYKITKEAVNADTVALEVLWTGQLAVAFGNLPAGSEMRAHSAMFLDFVDGKIIAQRNYDCFDPW
jgi:ketosteroid isomerase-like protein